MANYRFSVTKQGVQGEAVRAVYGDSIAFVIDRSNPPPANGGLVVSSQTDGVLPTKLFDTTHIALAGGEVSEQVRAKPGRDEIFAFEVGPDWAGGASGEGGGSWVPTKGKINVGSGSGGDD